MARSAGKKRSKGSPRVGRLALALLAAIVAVFTAFRWLGSPPGNVFLLDHGLPNRFSAVQQDLGGRIAEGARRGGVPAEGIRVTQPERDGEAATIEGQVPTGSMLIQINAAIDAAVREGGGRIRSCVESRDGRSMEMEIGTSSAVTHRCVFRKSKPRAPRPGERGSTEPKLTLIVDDFGYFDNRLVREFLALEIPFTVSVIPGLKHSTSIARKAAETGREVICHLPMEPERGAGDGGEIPLVRTGMRRAEIVKVVERALESTPGAMGMNNHMGSKATADRDVMDAVLSVCRGRGICFVDSYTTAKSVVAAAAGDAGVKTLRNDIFLDNKGEDVRENMHKMLAIAARKGSVTGILHVRRDNLQHLRWLASEARKEGIRIVMLSEMLAG
jgi:polysaccharide deacetylase 2 family uncharacterized protein YibQ